MSAHQTEFRVDTPMAISHLTHCPAEMVTGYLHPEYSASLAEFGVPRELLSSGGWVLERDIPGSPYRDAMGCYPLFSCQDWACLGQDLARLEGQLVSLALVTDPFGDFVVDDLAGDFDVFFRYKEHYVADLSRPIEKIVSKGHRREARRALCKVAVEPCPDPSAYVDEWTWLYGLLIKRHGIQGIRRFSTAAFERQLRLPGVVYFRVLSNGNPVGGNIFFVQHDVAYGHLSAFTDEGYSLGAAYAVKWAAYEYFADKVSWISLGAGAGLDQPRDNGLAFFKHGWATEMRPVYFCGRVLDGARYAELARTLGNPGSAYFPVYRAGEFK